MIMEKQEMEEFSRRPMMQQVSYVNLVSTTLFLLSLREAIVAKIKPDNEFMANINFIHFGNIFNQTRGMILKNVETKGERYATECLLTINRLLKHYFEGIQETRKDFEKREIPTIDIDQKTNELLEKIMNHLYENKNPEEWILKSEVIHSSNEDYAKKLRINMIT